MKEYDLIVHTMSNSGRDMVQMLIDFGSGYPEPSSHWFEPLGSVVEWAGENEIPTRVNQWGQTLVEAENDDQSVLLKLRWYGLFERGES